VRPIKALWHCLLTGREKKVGKWLLFCDILYGVGKANLGIGLAGDVIQAPITQKG